MPELPETQALAERLHPALPGRTLDRLELPGFSGLKTVRPSPDGLMGRTLQRVTRRGKYDVLGRERGRTGRLSAARLGDRFTGQGRAGQPCPRCGEAQRRVAYQTNEIECCPACQTGGRVLADRRLSRLLK